MKKLLLFCSIIGIFYACKKESVQPLQQKITQTSTRCQDSGICSEGYYESDSMYTGTFNNDTMIYQSNNSTLKGQVKLSFLGYGRMQGSVQRDTFLYRVTILDFSSNIIDTLTLQPKFTGKGSRLAFIILRTKYGNPCKFSFLHE